MSSPQSTIRNLSRFCDWRTQAESCYFSKHVQIFPSPLGIISGSCLSDMLSDATPSSLYPPSCVETGKKKDLPSGTSSLRHRFPCPQRRGRKLRFIWPCLPGTLSDQPSQGASPSPSLAVFLSSLALTPRQNQSWEARTEKEI